MGSFGEVNSRAGGTGYAYTEKSVADQEAEMLARKKQDEEIKGKLKDVWQNLNKPMQPKDKAPAEVVVPKDPKVVVDPNAVNPPAPGPTPPEDNLKWLKDFGSGTKDYFWDKDKGGVTGHGLLTLGLIARAVAGQREKNAGMTGGGMESAGVGQAMTGAFQGMNERNRQLELDALEREKLKNAKDIAGKKDDTVEDKAQEIYNRNRVDNAMLKQDWVSDEKLKLALASSPYAAEAATADPNRLRYLYLAATEGQGVADYFLARGGGTKGKSASAKLPDDVKVRKKTS